MPTKQFLILLVEEDKHLADIYSSFLKKEKFKVGVEHTGEGALTFLKRKKPNLVILDLLIPQTGGLEILKKIRAGKQTSSVPVIILTSIGQKDDVDQALKAGASEYLMKVYTKPNDLVKSVKNLLKIK